MWLASKAIRRSLSWSIFAGLVLATAPVATAELKAGAAVVDITPPEFPVIVNGGFLSRTADQVKTAVNARAIALSDGEQRCAIVVVDSCMLPRPLLDDVKQRASQRTDIAPDRILISATHTHTAPSCMGALGTGADAAYVSYVREKLAEAVAAAEANLEPAQVGWGTAGAADFTALRRWVRRSDRVQNDPFGNPTVRANMHAAKNWDDVTGPSGPEDPELSMISLQATDGRPIALLANFSMHYFGDQPISADYFGLFCERLEEQLGSSGASGAQPFVGLLSHGCSGDIWRRDYTQPASETPDWNIRQYAAQLADVALDTYRTIEYDRSADLAMAETRMQLDYRVPDQQRLEWAQRIVDAMGDRAPKDQTEVYAREQVILHERQNTEVVVQALRIGEIAVATTPTETYALTGLKLKKQSPLEQTMVIELANGGDGYIPPPEQHVLGGYNTWPARSAGLEIEAEPKIAEAALQLLERVADQPRRPHEPSTGPAASSLRAAGPVAYWRLDDMAGPRAVDSSGEHRDGFYEPGVVFFLEGPQQPQFCSSGETNRAAHFAGGRLKARLAELGENYSVSLWFWNGMPPAARETTGWLFSRDFLHGVSAHGEHVGLGGTATEPGRLIYQPGQGEPVVGKTAIERWTWNHLLMVRDGNSVKVHLNGNEQPEIETEAPGKFPAAMDRMVFGGRSDNRENFEGRLDEIAVFDRAVSPEELAKK